MLATTNALGTRRKSPKLSTADLRPNPLRMDPTGTGQEQKRLKQLILSRFRVFKKQISKLIVEEDSFGLKNPEQVFNTPGHDQKTHGRRTGAGKLNQAGLSKLVKLAALRKFVPPIEFGIQSNVSDSKPPTIRVDRTSSAVKDVSIGELESIGDIDNVKVSEVMRFLAGKKADPVTVTKFNGKLFLVDGHHRVAAGVMRGESTIRADVLDLDSNTRNVRNSLTTNQIWRFLGDDEKVDEYIEWARRSMSLTVLARLQVLGQSNPDHWLTEHIERTYLGGMSKAFDVIRKPELQDQLDFYQGRKAEFLASAFTTPVSSERVKLLAGRALGELEGMTDRMAVQMRRSLTDGFIRGDSPREIARQLTKDVDDLSRVSAERIANTEVVRAHNEGQLDAMERLGVTDVGVTVEWTVSGLGTTAKGNPSPCRLCSPMEGVVFKVSEAHGMIPRHPNCRCSFLPSGVGEDDSEQKKTQKSIKSAIERSLEAERPKKKKVDVKPSRWVGSKTKIAKRRPVSILDEG